MAASPVNKLLCTSPFLSYPRVSPAFPPNHICRISCITPTKAFQGRSLRRQLEQTICAQAVGVCKAVSDWGWVSATSLLSPAPGGDIHTCLELTALILPSSLKTGAMNELQSRGRCKQQLNCVRNENIIYNSNTWNGSTKFFVFCLNTGDFTAVTC